jgi:hypothetical protein
MASITAQGVQHVSITRICDYCQKPEAEAGFVQHYRVLPTRPAPTGFAAGARAFDLCCECVELITSPATVETVAPVKDEEPLRFAERGGPVLVTDGKGNTRVIRERNRPGRCTSKAKSTAKNGGARCVWDEGHTGQHKAANGQHWS